MKIGHPKDFWGGVCFAALGLMFAVIAYGIKFGDTVLIPGYAMGVPARMGPAFFPFWLGSLLFVLGLAIALTGFKTHGKGGELEKWHWGPLGYVLISIVIFGLLLKSVGMLLSGIVLVVGASLGSHDFKLRPVLLLAIFLVVFCALVFVVGLKLPIPLCPDIEALQQFGVCRA